MTTTTATYDQPSVWAPLLVEWAERGQRDLLELAEDSRQKGHRKNAAALKAEAGRFVWIADYGRARLVDVSDLSTDDAEQLAEINALTARINDEPPLPLVDLTAWLRGKLGYWFPSVPSVTWQTIAFLLDARRRPT